MNEHDDAYVDAILMVNMLANTRIVTKMAPFEALYRRKCRNPLNWVEPGERRYYGIDFVNEAEQQVRTIQQHLEADQAR